MADKAVQIVATLVTQVAQVKAEGLVAGFGAMLKDVKGRTFGAKLVRHVLTESDPSGSLGAFEKSMVSAVDMMLRAFTDASPSYQEAMDYIAQHGGLQAMHTEYLALRRADKSANRAKQEV